MGKKMKLPFLFRSSSDIIKSSSWPWPSCNLEPRTLSFRTPDDVLKTINTNFLDKDVSSSNLKRDESSCFFTNIDERPSLSNQIEGDQVEIIIKGLRSDRLFFEPGETSSILTNTTKLAEPSSSSSLSSKVPFKENTMLMSMDSHDPYMDFKKSMEEMVEAHDLKDWKCLEELLFCYLRVNEKNNHEYILGAFVDLLVGLSLFASSSSSTNTSTSCSNIVCSSSTTSFSPCSPLSFYTSNSSSLSSSTTPCASSLRIEEEEEEEEDIDLSCSCLSSPLEVEKKIVHVKDDDDDDDDVSSYDYGLI